MKKLTVLMLFCVSAVAGFSQTHVGDSLKALLKNAKQDTVRCNLLVKLAEHLYQFNADTVIPLSVETITIADKALAKANASERAALLLSKASALNNIGIIKAEQGHIPEAIDYYLKSLQAHIDNKNKIGIASAYHNLGFTYDNSGDVPMAMEYYHKALKIQEELGDKGEIAMTINDIGYLYETQGDITRALDYYNKSLAYRRETKDKYGESMSLNNIAHIYEKHGIPGCRGHQCLMQGKQKALELYKKCLSIHQETGNLRGRAYSLNNIAIIYKEIGDEEVKGTEHEKMLAGEKLALNYFDQSLAIHRQIKNNVGIAYVTNNLANLYLKQGKTREALELAQSSMAIARELGQPEIIYRDAGTLKNIFKKLGRSNEAYQMLELEIEMRDSIKSQNNRKVSIQKEFQYLYEKKAAADSVKILEEKKVVNAQLKQERTQRFALYGGLVLVALFGIFMFNRFKVTQKQNHLIQEQKAELQKQKDLVEEHQKETLDSIHYAKRIQSALIANADFISQHIPGNFILFRPKDIVSGDFYWATMHNNIFYLAVCDSTGHGVPGAFMSLLNMGFLSEAIKEKNLAKPNVIFNYVRERLITTIGGEGQKDGMDGILVAVNKATGIIEYCAANNAPVLIRDGEIMELPKDKMPVGKGERTESFTLHTLELKAGDSLYVYTDGYADQFGGPKGKKFKYRQLNELLLAISSTPLLQQKTVLETEFANWKGGQEQVDDVLVVGIRM
jgi:serine phosphatase RsbU (regulator of sigma subunit)